MTENFPSSPPAGATRAELIQADIEDVARQVAQGELDQDTARMLVEKYRQEQASLATASAAPEESPPARSRTRAVVGTVLLGGLFVAVAITAWIAIGSGGSDRLPSGTPVDLAEVSNDQMEAVIAANLDRPEIAGMRLVLADRYFELGSFSSALPHYLGALQGRLDISRRARALARVGWMSHLSGESQLAETYLLEALSTDSQYQEANLFLGLVWLDLGNPDQALDLLEPLLAGDDLPQELRPMVEQAASQALAQVDARQ